MIIPNIIRGGNAIPIDNNLFYMKGRKHKNGGIDIGKDLEVEDGEIMQTSPKEIKVFSAQKFLGGQSPADLIISGADPDKVFAAQEQYKNIHGINDDGSRKKAKWGWFKKLLGIDENDNVENIQTPVKGEDNNDVDYDGDVASRQVYAESKYDINAKSNKDAKGLYQIRPIGVKEYNRQTGDSISYDSVLNPDTAIMVRNKLMDTYMNKSWVANPKNESDTVTVFKAAMAYNMGENNARLALNSMKENGIDIYSINGLLNGIKNVDVKSYAGFIATGNSQKDKIYLNDSIYKVYRAKNKDLDDKIRKSQKFGNMNKNNKDNSPFTGEEKKAYGGRKKADFGTFASIYGGLSGLTNIGNIFAGSFGAKADYNQRVKRIEEQRKILNSLKAPVEQHIKRKTNYNINPQLSEIDVKLGLTNKDIDENTSNSQTALERKRDARLNAFLQKNKLFGQKENIETQWINDDLKERAAVDQRNIERKSQYRLMKTINDMKLEEELGDAKSNYYNNLTGSIMSGLTGMTNSLYDLGYLGAAAARNPNGTNAAFGWLPPLPPLRKNNKTT